MRSTTEWLRDVLLVLCVLSLAFMPQGLEAQQTSAAQPQEQEEERNEEEPPEEDDQIVTEVIVVTGSRIARDPLDEPAPITEISVDDIQRSGLTNLGATLQQLPVTGSAINTRFNVPGNSGFPQDGTGIGAGAIELSLRNVGAKRTLVLVDGKRWIAGASASGVPNAVDLNTIPANVIQKIEILQDGASAIYGSDAIGGVVNIITAESFDGFRVDLQTGGFISEGDGEASEVSLLWGGGADRTRFLVSGSYVQELGVETWDRAQSAFPTPFATSCLAGGCSSFTPQGRFILGPAFGFLDMTLNTGVLNDGSTSVPVFDPNDPNGGDFHQFSTADRFNFNGPGFNFLQTPNERFNIYASARHEISDTVRAMMKTTYTNRKSRTKAAPEPLCFGNGCGNRILENIVIDADQIYNPFGVDLSVADGTLEFFGRRPLESGPRIFEQDVNTWFSSLTFDGIFSAAARDFLWDVTASYGDNRGFQQKFNSHNAAKLAVALGDPAVCAATPNCVPFNLFGGQGPDGRGSITQEMLDFVGYTQRDFSEQTLFDVTANLAGELVTLPTGMVGFAAGVEYRDHEGSFQPDPIAARGETAGIPSAPTAGGFDVAEFYGEISVPIETEAAAVDHLEFNLAARYSDYSTFGGESTYKVSGLWRPVRELSFRGSVSTGIRAPGIGELFGGAAREDFTFLDPCVDVFGAIGAANGGRDEAQPQQIIDNCAALGLPPDLVQRNPQLSAISAGNENLIAETSDNYSFGLVYSPTWQRRGALTASLDYYDLTIDDAVQGRDPGDVIIACVNTLDPFFCNAVERTSSGVINLVDNQLQNIGAIEASGVDLGLNYSSQRTSFGVFNAMLMATYLADYVEFTARPDGTFARNERAGTITDETFQRAWPDLRMTSAVEWTLDPWNAGLTFRWVDSMIQASGNELSSTLFTDIRLRYSMPVDGNDLHLTVGVNNVLDEDPATCDSCGVIGMSPVVHDLPGRIGYVRLSLTL
ncbi:MAG: TonB-dependent receptor [Acidobacteria bacterium]|nr:TonB-dependent receptor [Acidobacteriota bacterium]